MNKEFQEDFLRRYSYKPIYDGFEKSSSFHSEKYDCVYDALLKFCKDNENRRIVILSKWCKNVPGLKFEAVLKSLPVLKIKGRVLPFRDEDYLEPIGNIKEILISIKELKLLCAFFDISRKESGKAINNNAYFSLSDYERYITVRKKRRAFEQAKNDEYFEKICFDEKSYFKKEYVSKHKYAADYLQSWVEENKKNITEGEKAAKAVLDEMCVDYEFQKPCLVAGRSYIMDFYLENFGICIEIDGGYHNTTEQLLRDRERTNILAKSGVLVVRFTNEEAMNGSSIKTFLLHIFNEL